MHFLPALLVCTATVLGLAGCASTSAPRQTLVLATGAPGGAFAEYGPGISKVIAAHSRFDLAQKPTAGSNDNVRLVNDASVPLGLVNMGPAYEAWTGADVWKGEKLTNLRALVPMYETPFHIIALKSSSIRSLRDLQGKRVGVAPGSRCFQPPPARNPAASRSQWVAARPVRMRRPLSSPTPRATGSS